MAIQKQLNFLKLSPQIKGSLNSDQNLLHLRGIWLLLGQNRSYNHNAYYLLQLIVLTNDICDFFDDFEVFEFWSIFAFLVRGYIIKLPKIEKIFFSKL